MTLLSFAILDALRRSEGRLAFVAAGLLVACGGDWTGDSKYQPRLGVTPGFGENDYPHGLHAAGNQIQDSDGNVVTLHGVNRSGSEYSCVHGQFFDGDFDDASVAAMTTWNINAVRVPLNESCWLGINGVSSAVGGTPYKKAISDYVTLLHRHSLIPILELHWTAPGDQEAVSQPLAPDLDHAVDTWADIAKTFANDSGVIFEPFNEPVYDAYFTDDYEQAWVCWRDGCDVPDRMLGQATIPGFRAAGIQDLLDAIRGAEKTAGKPSHLVIQGGLAYSNDLEGFLTHEPKDSEKNFGGAWHVYNFNACRSIGCWDGAPADVAAKVPLVVTELGEDDCAGDFIEPLMQWLDQQSLGYLAWSWNANGACVANPHSTGMQGNPWGLIQDYKLATPNGVYATTFHDHLAALSQ